MIDRFIIIFIILVLLQSCKVASTTQIFVVRHAERTALDDLTSQGVTRAEELKRVLTHSGVDSVFSTDSVRVRKTVKPLADQRGVPLIIYNDISGLLSRIISKSKGKTVLVGGHSNTVPQLIQQCGCAPPYQVIPSTEFDNLFLIILQKEKINNQTSTRCKLVHMKYGLITN